MYDEERLADLRHDCEGDEYVGHVCARCDWGSGFSPASRWGMCERDYSMCDAYGTCPEWENWEEEHEQAYESR